MSLCYSAGNIAGGKYFFDVQIRVNLFPFFQKFITTKKLLFCINRFVSNYLSLGGNSVFLKVMHNNDRFLQIYPDLKNGPQSLKMSEIRLKFESFDIFKATMG